MKFFTVVIILLCFCVGNAVAECQSTGTKDWTTDGNEYADFKECLDEVTEAADKDGHTIHVIAGDGEATWSTQVNITSSTPNLKIIGPGKTSLKIILGITQLFRINDTNARISGFYFYTTNGYSAVCAQGHGWRIDHCKYEYYGATGSNGVFIRADCTGTTNHPRGVIDANEIINGKVHVFSGSEGEAAGASFLKESSAWYTAASLGTDDAVYIENNSFYTDHNYATNCIDSNRGGRYVARFNTTSHTDFEAHSLMMADTRATRKTEIYNNIIYKREAGWAHWSAAHIRGGTGVFFNNETDYDNVLVLDTQRDTYDVGGTVGVCDGTSQWDENTAEEDGWLCRDQIGAGIDVSLWEDSSDLPGPAQANEPYLVWGNTISLSPATPTLGAGNKSVVENRDYCNAATCSGDSCDYTCGGIAISYKAYQCPHYLVGEGTCDYTVKGTGGYHIGNSMSIGSGASMSIGSGAVMTLQ